MAGATEAAGNNMLLTLVLAFVGTLAVLLFVVQPIIVYLRRFCIAHRQNLPCLY